jgi:hypothetical protein
MRLHEARTVAHQPPAFRKILLRSERRQFLANREPRHFLAMGHVTRLGSEPVLLGLRGSPVRLHNDVRQVVIAPVGEHSEKPKEVRRRIERLYPGPYLELFGRKEAPGWVVWGNEIPRADMALEIAPMTTPLGAAAAATTPIVMASSAPPPTRIQASESGDTDLDVAGGALQRSES